MFGDDSFMGIEDMFNQLAGRTRRSSSRNNNSTTLLNVIEEKNRLYFIFDFSGKIIISVNIKDELEINDYGEEVASGNKIIEIKTESESIKYTLPGNAKKMKMSHTFSNGILEVKLEK